MKCLLFRSFSGLSLSPSLVYAPKIHTYEISTNKEPKPAFQATCQKQYVISMVFPPPPSLHGTGCPSTLNKESTTEFCQAQGHIQLHNKHRHTFVPQTPLKSTVDRSSLEDTRDMCMFSFFSLPATINMKGRSWLAAAWWLLASIQSDYTLQFAHLSQLKTCFNTAALFY